MRRSWVGLWPLRLVCRWLKEGGGRQREGGRKDLICRGIKELPMKYRDPTIYGFI